VDTGIAFLQAAKVCILAACFFDLNPENQLLKIKNKIIKIQINPMTKV